tara:strand:- start:25350 stop:27038 length:1689 start_codon:yes stop_codon:yes gene_type:complete
MIKKYSVYFGIFLLGIGVGYFIINKSLPIDTKSNNNSIGASFTCSMHPAINTKEPGKCSICGMDLIVKTSETEDYLNSNSFNLTENAIQLSNIETMIVGKTSGKGYTTAQLSGIVSSNLQTNSIQTTLFDGRLDKLEINYIGKNVSKGQQIGVMYSPEMYAAQDKLLTSASYKESHEKLFNAARNTLGLWKMTDKQIEEVLRTGKPLMNFPLYADVSGTVTEIIAQEGKYFKQGDPLYKLSNLGTVWAIFDVYENQISQIKVGQEISISSPSIKGETFKSTIVFIDPILDSAKRTVSIRAVLNNRSQKFKPGMFVKGIVKMISSNNEAIRVPSTAVLWTGKRSIVYVKTYIDQPVFELREVTLGNIFPDGDYEILEGLYLGEEIVTNGTFTVDAAAQLLGKKSMMSTSSTEENNQFTDLNDFNKAKNIDFDYANLLYLYEVLKNYFVDSNSKNVAEAADSMNKFLRANNLKKNEFENIKIELKKIAASKNIEKQRYSFKILSNDLLKILPKKMSIKEPLYIQYCPMADKNKGAYWLSFTKEIRNPYYGDKMLNCGSITETLN